VKNVKSGIQYEIFNVTRDGNVTKFVSSRQDVGATLSVEKMTTNRKIEHLMVFAISEITAITEELRVATLLTGRATLAALKKCPLIITGDAKETLQHRGVDLTELQVRR
jgi:hypothetical protein